MIKIVLGENLYRRYDGEEWGLAVSDDEEEDWEVCSPWFSAALDEIERLRASEGDLSREIEEFRTLFDLQWARTKEADALYVAAHPRPDFPHGYKPDLGKLIGWLLEFYRYVEDEPCGCVDEWGNAKPQPCERCRLLGKYVREAPHPMPCVQHGGSAACEAENRRNGFICPQCFHEATMRAAAAREVDDRPCRCRSCLRERDEQINGLPAEMCLLIVCPQCGNKRCPHANDHRNPCTGSNEVGQPGSAYPKPEPQP